MGDMAEQFIYVAPHKVRAARLLVEMLEEDGEPIDPALRAIADAEIVEWALDGHGNLVDLAAPLEPVPYGPPPSQWVNVLDVPKAYGEIAATHNHEGVTWDLRCVSEPFVEAGTHYVMVCTETVWLHWRARPSAQRPERPAPARAVEARHCWIDVRGTAHREGER